MSQNVVDDLELEKGAGETSVYETLFQPHHVLGQNMIEDWKKYFTSNKQYILDTQMIQETDCDTSFFESHDVKDSELLEIWKDLKVPHAHFLEKYCYIEWDIVESLNQSSYLQIMSMLNMMSPVISLLMPLLFFIFPFIILNCATFPLRSKIKILRYCKISFYRQPYRICPRYPLKKWSIFSLVCLCFYQIYQNVVSCKDFTKYTKVCFKMTLKVYLGHTIKNMTEFLLKHHKKLSYQPFCEDVLAHKEVLERGLQSLQNHHSRNFTLMNVSHIGYVLKNYYEFHANGDFDTSLRYSFGFHGFLDNIRGIRHHLHQQRLSCVAIDNVQPALSVVNITPC